MSAFHVKQGLKLLSKKVPKAKGFLARTKELGSFGRARQLEKYQTKWPLLEKMRKGERAKEIGKGVGMYGAGAAGLGGIGGGGYGLAKKGDFHPDEAFAYGFFDELEKIAVDWSVLAPALGGAALGGAAGGYTGYKATKAVGGGKKSRIAGAALGGLGGAALGGGVGHAGALAFQPEAAGEMGIKQLTLPFRAAGVAAKGAYRGGKGVVDYLKAVGRGAGKGMADIAPLRLGGRAARAAHGG